jgi:tetratricopeptide (TPR) repeat protein
MGTEESPMKENRRPRERANRLLIGAVLSALIATAGLADTPPKDYEAISLFGRKLISPAPDPAALQRYEQARAAFAAAPTEENYIWLGRRTAYLGRYREAIGVYSEGLAKFPGSYRLYRHRGHRYLSIRQLGRAVADLERAAALVQGQILEVEPDGVPNKTGTPVSNTQFNIHYHLGLAYFLTRDFAKAEAAYRECLRWSKNDDSVVAVTDWLYMTLRRMGKTAEADQALAPIHRGLKLIENGAYLDRLLMFKGLISEIDFAKEGPDETAPEKAIRTYGLGLARLWRGEKDRARDSFKELAWGDNWASFATIAAEVELADLVRIDPDRATVGTALTAWNLSWNIYDLDLAGNLFVPGSRTTYFSSEKPGRIAGFEALMQHHRGFGFVPGGKTADNRLWLENFTVWEEKDMAFVTAGWGFDRDVAGPGPVQRGPVTFILVRGDDGWRIVHAHFANDPAAPVT